MLKESDNPPVAWPEIGSIDDFEGRWWVLHTKSRNEKALAHDLVTKNIKYFLPMSWKVKKTSGRKIKSLLPLFTGYMFFCGDENERTEILRTNHVANILDVPNQRKLVSELLQIEHAIKAGAPLEPHSFVKEGALCRVIAGALAGLEGVVIRCDNKSRLILQIDILGQGASIEIDSDMIEAVEKEDGRDS